MDPILNTPQAPRFHSLTAAPDAIAPEAAVGAPLAVPEAPADTRQIAAGGLIRAAERATAGEYVPAVDVPTRSRPADPPTPRENFKQAASEALLSLTKLSSFFFPMAQLEAASQPLYLRLRGLAEALGDRLYNSADVTTMSQDQLLRFLQAVQEIRATLEDGAFSPDPATVEGRREIDSLFTKLDSALLLPHGEARPPSPPSNFNQAAMEEIAVLNRLLGCFDPLSRLEPESEALYHKLVGLLEALNGRMYDLRNPAGMSQEELLGVLRAAREIRMAFEAEGFRTPDPRTPEGRREIEAHFANLPVFVGYGPADPPTPRENFKQAGMEGLAIVTRLGAYFSPMAQVEAASQPLYLRLRGLAEALGDRLYNAADLTTMSQDQLLRFLQAVQEIHATLEDGAFRPDPATVEGRREIDSLFTKLDSALLLPHGEARPPSLPSNFNQAAMEEIAILNRLLGCFDPLSRLEPESEALYRKLAGLLEALNGRMYDLRHPAGLSQEELLGVLRAAREIRAAFEAEGFGTPDPRTPEGRREIEVLFAKLPVFVSYKLADPPTDRQNFLAAGMEGLSVLNRLGGYFDDLARLEEPGKALYLKVSGLVAALNDRTLDYADKTGFPRDQLIRVLTVVGEVRRQTGDDAFRPDPRTVEGQRELEALLAKLDAAFALPRSPESPPSQQDHFRQGGMEALSVLNRLGALFDDLARVEPETQPLYLKLGGLIHTIGDRLYGHQRLGSLHPARLVTLLKTARTIREVLGDPGRAPDPRTAEGRSKLDGFVTTLASQIGLPFA